MRSGRIDMLLAAVAVAALLAATIAGWSFVDARSKAGKYERRARAAAEEIERLEAAASRAASGPVEASPSPVAESAEAAAERAALRSKVEALESELAREKRLLAAATAAAETARAEASRVADASRVATPPVEPEPARPSADVPPSDAATPTTSFAAAASAALGAADLSAALDGLARAEAWGPFLRESFTQPGAAGVRAVEIFGALSTTTEESLVSALDAARRTDAAFVAAAGVAWAKALEREGADVVARLAVAVAKAPHAARRLAALSAACSVSAPDAAAWIAASAAHGPLEREFAVSRLPALGVAARFALLAAATSDDAPPEFRSRAIGSLLSVATADEAAAVATAAMESPDASKLLATAPVSEAAAPFLTAAAVDRAFRDDAALKIAAERLGLAPSAAPRAVVSAAFGDRATTAALGASARIRRPQALASLDEAAALLPTALPSDLRDLVAVADEAFDVAAAQGVYGVAATMGHPGAIVALRRAMLAEDPAVRAAAALSAVRAPETAVDVASLIADPDEVVRFAAAAALTKERVALPPSIAAPLLLDAREGGLAEALVDGMARHPDADLVLATCLEALDANQVRAPHIVAALVVRIARDRGFRFIDELTARESPELRAAALEELVPTNDVEKARYAAIFDRAASDPAVVVRTRAARGLGRLDDDLSRARLVQLTADPSEWVRAAAAWALRGHDPAKAVPAVRRAAEDPVEDTAIAGLAALLKFGVVQSPERLVEALDDPCNSGLARLALESWLGPFATRAEAEEALRTRHGAPDSRR